MTCARLAYEEKKPMTVLVKILGGAFAVVMLVGSWLMFAPAAPAASLQEITNFGTNPSNLRMYVYRPDTVAASASRRPTPATPPHPPRSPSTARPALSAK
jgi:hypothetical protein